MPLPEGWQQPWEPRGWEGAQILGTQRTAPTLLSQSVHCTDKETERKRLFAPTQQLGTGPGAEWGGVAGMGGECPDVRR